jgi:hypothetical protein
VDSCGPSVEEIVCFSRVLDEHTHHLYQLFKHCCKLRIILNPKRTMVLPLGMSSLRPSIPILAMHSTSQSLPAEDPAATKGVTIVERTNLDIKIMTKTDDETPRWVLTAI